MANFNSFGILVDMFKFLFVLLLPFIMILIYFVVFVISTLLYKIFVKKEKPKKAEEGFKPIIKRRSIIKRFFFDFPKQLCFDILNRTPGEMKESGLHMFVGEQGSGKTIACCELLMRMKERYPKCIIRTNMAYKYQDSEVRTWEDLVNNNNGVYGQFEVIDEIQTWWSSADSGKMSAEMLENICQQRKQRKVLYGTAQVFSRISKEIREQTSVVYCPKTFYGCLTIVRVSKPKYWNNEKQLFSKYTNTYFFVHSKELRDSYDTYKVISRFSEVGANDRTTANDIIINLNEK